MIFFAGIVVVLLIVYALIVVEDKLNDRDR